MLNNNLSNLKTIEVGGYKLPADFKYLDKAFLSGLIGKDFSEKVKSVYSKFSDRIFNFEDFSNFLEVSIIDDSICAIDFSTLKNANYNDFIFDNSDLFGQVSSIISYITASYLDLVESNVINLFEEVNFATPLNDGLFMLSLYIAKIIGLPINTVIVGCETPINETLKNVYFDYFSSEEIEDIIGVFYDEYGIAVDFISALSICAMDSYYDNYIDDNRLLVTLLISSPYLFSRKVLKAITGEVELSVSRALEKLYLETSSEIPESIVSNEIPPYYVQKEKLPYNIAISFIKALSKVWFLFISMIY